MNLTRIQQ